MLEFRGVGAPEVKSAELLFVSVNPPARRMSAVVLVPAGAAAEPSNAFAVPYPTKSTTLVSAGPEIAVAVIDNATLPLVALKFMPPVLSAVGNATPIAPPLASDTNQ